MSEAVAAPRLADREAVLHALYEASELEHNLMCTYLYAAFSLRSDAEDGLAADELEAVGRWRQALFDVAIEEMSHLAAVWNITSALGGSPRVGRSNFPIDPGLLPASVVVKLAPFNANTLQHFIYLERPAGSDERDSEAFAIERNYVRGSEVQRLTPMGINYDTVGNFYTTLALGLRALVERCGEEKVFVGDPALQISLAEFGLSGAKPVICAKTALAAFESIVMQGEGAPRDMMGSHFQRFLSVREDLLAFQRKRPGFSPAFPAATNPVLRRPPRPEGRVWIEDAEASAVVDLANASYSLMLRLFAYAYLCRAPGEEKALVLRLAIGMMHVIVPLAERASRLPAGPSNPDCHAGISFTTLRDASPLQPGRAARVFFIERLQQLADVAVALATGGDRRVQSATEHLLALARQANRGFDLGAPAMRRGRASGGESRTASVSRVGLDDRRRRRARAGREAGADVRNQALHPCALLCHRRSEGVSCERVGTVDSSRRDAGRAGRRDRARLSFGCDPLSPRRRRQRRGGTARQSRGRARARALRVPRPITDRRRGARLSRDAVSVRCLEEQAVLRRLSQRNRLRRVGRAPEPRDAGAARARRRARDRSAAERSARGPR